MVDLRNLQSTFGSTSGRSRNIVSVSYKTIVRHTTANAVSAVLLLFAEHPDQWDLLRAQPDLQLSAIRECLRLESPAQWFSRVTTADVDFGGIQIAAPTRTLHSYGAANRDGREFKDPEKMDITRNPMKALTWGYGAHTCPGQFISVMETGALLGAMIRRIKRIELTAPPRRQLHNLARVGAELPLRVTPD